jgi:SAM-dependent methyltransferase
MTRRVDFSRNAAIYDRRHGAAVLNSDLVQVCNAAHLEVGCRVLDIGAGTGRISIPLSDLGYKMVALEPAPGMLEQLRVKADGRGIETLLSEGSQLPIEAASFDAVVMARLLYLTPDWKTILGEAIRVLKPDGVLLHEWGNGSPTEEWVQIREKARVLFQAAGVVAPFHPGASDEMEIENYLAGAGLHVLTRVSLGAGPLVTLREFLRRLADGELSYIWDVPTEVRASSLPVLQQWAQKEFDLEANVSIPKNIEWSIYRRHVIQQTHVAIRYT